MAPDPLAARLAIEAAAVGVSLSEKHVDLLRQYLHLISAWRVRAGLTAVANSGDAARVHIADSLLCLRAGFPDGAAVIDVGSGAGLPGMPLRIVRPDLRMTLLEANARRAGFLEVVNRQLALALTVVHRRAEDAGCAPEMRERYHVAVARAVAPLPALCELVLPFVALGGMAVLLKGPAAGRELLAARRAIEVLGGGDVRQLEAGLAGGERRVVVVIPKARPTPRSYPRRAGVPSRRPL